MAAAAVKKAEVLIVGAGPAGLMMAYQLLRYGVQPYVIDAQKQDTEASDPVILQPRSLEYFRQIGLDDELIRTGMSCHTRMDYGKKPAVTVDLTPPAAWFPAFSYFLVTAYQDIERPLINRLTNHTCPVHWRTSLTNVFQNDLEVIALIDQAGSRLELRCKWIVYTISNVPLINKQKQGILFNQRSFLIGAAINRYMAPQGQNVNTALQDAENLAWKLAYVHAYRASPALLNSYQLEREHIPNDLLSLKEASPPLLSVPKPLFRNKLLAALQTAIFKRHLSKVKNLLKLRAAITQLSISYRHSPLAVHHAYGNRIKAGDRLPDMPVFDEKTKKNTSLQQWCQKPGFVLILLGTLNTNSLFMLSQWVLQKFPHSMHLYYLPYSAANNLVFEAFELIPEATKMLIVRPDMHIGYMNDTISAALIETYMEGIIGLP